MDLWYCGGSLDRFLLCRRGRSGGLDGSPDSEPAARGCSVRSITVTSAAWTCQPAQPRSPERRGVSLAPISGSRRKAGFGTRRMAAMTPVAYPCDDRRRKPSYPAIPGLERGRCPVANVAELPQIDPARRRRVGVRDAAIKPSPCRPRRHPGSNPDRAMALTARRPTPGRPMPTIMAAVQATRRRPIADC